MGCDQFFWPLADLNDLAELRDGQLVDEDDFHVDPGEQYLPDEGQDAARSCIGARGPCLAAREA